MAEIKFGEVAKMFNELKAKGYSVEEICAMPVFVGEK